MQPSLPKLYWKKERSKSFWSLELVNIIAYYGYKDGSGDYFIIIDTGKCMQCEGKFCLEACPAGLLEKFIDDYDDEVVGVREEHRNKIKYSCASCKPVSGKQNLACRNACKMDAIKHSW